MHGDGFDSRHGNNVLCQGINQHFSLRTQERSGDLVGLRKSKRPHGDHIVVYRECRRLTLCVNESGDQGNNI